MNEEENELEEDEPTALTIPSTPILPTVDRKEVKKFQRNLTALKEAILVNKVDYVIETIKQKQRTIFFRSGWEKIAAFFNISTEIVNKEYREFEGNAIKITRDKDTDKITKKEVLKDNDGIPIKKTYFAYEFTVKAFCGNRSNESVGACSSDENKTFHHPMHDIMATAHTRAKGRAICAMIGAGLSFEEISDVKEIKQHDQQQTPRKKQIKPGPIRTR